MSRTEDLIARALDRVAFFCDRFPWLVAPGVLILSAAALYGGMGHLGVNTDATQMISADLPFQVEGRRYDAAFPQYNDNLIVVVDGETVEAADATTAHLTRRIRESPEIFAGVFAPSEDPYFRENALLYRDVDSLEEFTDSLAKAQPFLAKLTADPTLRGLFGSLNQALDALERGDVDNIRVGPILDRMAETTDAAAAGTPGRLSWSDVMVGGGSDVSDRRRILMAQPSLDFAQLLPAEAAIQAIRGFAAELSPADAAKVRVTGDLALNYEEMKGLKDGAAFSSILSFGLVFATLIVGLRRVRLVAATALVLIVGLALTAGLAGLTIGRLNMISVAFAILYIGLGVDYAIHFCLHFQESVQNGLGVDEAMRTAVKEVGSSLFLCALTTSIGFFVFIPTDYKGVSELGLISGVGMIVSLFVTVTFLPATLKIFSLSARRHAPRRIEAAVRSAIAAPVRYATAVRRATLALALVALFLLPGVAFDYNPINLRDPKAESVIAIRDIAEGNHATIWNAIVLAEADEAAEIAAKLEELEAVDDALWVEEFVPADQEEKLPLIEDLALVLGPAVSSPTVAEPPSTGERLAAMDGFEERISNFVQKHPDSEDAAPARRLIASLAEWRSALDASGDGERDGVVEELETAMLGTFPQSISRLEEALRAGPVSLEDVPLGLRERWVSPDGLHRIEVHPLRDPENEGELARFVDQIRTVAPHVTGEAVGRLEAGNAVIRAFKQAFLSATIAIFVLLLFIFRRVWDAVLILMPLLLAAAFTGAVCVLLGISFNFANVIALPLLLGIGVDNGIHIVHRVRATGDVDESSILHSSTARGVIYSALTTAFSFGTLVFMGHRGLSSMGWILTLGVFFTLVAALMILPALLRWDTTRRGGKPAV